MIFNNKDNNNSKDNKDYKDNNNNFNDQINYDINENLNENSNNDEIDDKINDELKWNQEDVNKLLEIAEEETRKENTKCKYYLYSILFGLVSYYFYY